MSLTAKDLEKIRNIVISSLSIELKPIKDELDMLRNDIKEIYFMIADLQRSSITDKDFKKLSLEKKLLTLNAELISAARQAGITLPRP
ncbi:hypothetical protein M1512_03365 [Patescibacteria group bacterium]|nr:hypothetical protein [Patescibacteria group bacterium]